MENPGTSKYAVYFRSNPNTIVMLSKSTKSYVYSIWLRLVEHSWLSINFI